MATIKITIKTPSIGKDVKQLERSYIASLENRLSVSSKVKYICTIELGNPTPRYFF